MVHSAQVLPTRTARHHLGSNRFLRVERRRHRDLDGCLDHPGVGCSDERVTLAGLKRELPFARLPLLQVQTDGASRRLHAGSILRSVALDAQGDGIIGPLSSEHRAKHTAQRRKDVGGVRCPRRSRRSRTRRSGRARSTGNSARARAS